MSYRKIYGIGNTPEEALLYAKINEIGHRSKTRFLKKTNVKCLEYSKTLETDLFSASLTYDRELTISEAKSIKNLKNTYCDKDYNIILDIYRDIDSNYSICFKIDTSNEQNLYKFLY
jgi:hypothetical protein